MAAGRYRIESSQPLTGRLLPAPAQGRLYLNRALAISIAVKCATSPIQQQVRVIHEPSGEVVFTTTLVDRSPPVGLVPDLDES